MSYKRKTRDIWEVQGLYCGQWEAVTTEGTRRDAKIQKACYDTNERGIAHRIVKKRERLEVSNA